MAVYFFTGKLGSGKTLCAVGRIRDYLREGRRVATNLDLNLSALAKKRKDYKWDVTRLPDKPRLQDMQQLGRGCDIENEQKYGLIVLDELGTWFNSRKWQDKERLPLIDWFLHARKHHWDIIFIVQDIDAIDAQLRGALCEHLVTCRRLDRLPIPLVGSLLKLFELPAKMPKIHVATVRYGESDSAPVVHRWVYSGKDLYKVYDTAQVFSDQMQVVKSTGELADMRTSYTLLSPYHLNGCRRLENAKTELINAQTYFKSRTTVAKPVRPARAAGRPYGIIAVSSVASLLLGAASVYAVGRVSMGDAAPAAIVAKTPDTKTPTIKKDTSLELQQSPLDLAITTNVLRTRGIIVNGADIYATIDIYNKKNELISKLDLKHVKAAGWAVSKNALGLTLYNGTKTVRVPLV